METKTEKKITTFIFDCFGVICSEVISNWYKECVLDKGFIDESFREMMRQFDLGKIDEQDLLNHFTRYEVVSESTIDLKEKIESYLHVRKDVVEVIRSLKQKGYTIALLSNGSLDTFKQISKIFPDFDSLFDEKIISCGIGMVKPDTEIYKYALEKMSVSPGEAVFVDDRQKNLDAANELGISTILFEGSEKLKDDIEGFLLQ